MIYKKIYKKINYILFGFMLSSCSQGGGYGSANLFLLNDILIPRGARFCTIQGENTNPYSKMLQTSPAEFSPSGDGIYGEGMFDTPYGTQLLPYEQLDSGYIVGGDMIFRSQAKEEAYGSSDPRSRGAAVAGRNLRWINNEIHYIITTADSVTVRAAIAHIEAYTSYRFIEGISQNYINFVNRGSSYGCYSYVGMQGGEQQVQLAYGCGTGGAIHEILHAVGLLHEQNRMDRDLYVKIDFSNIQKGKESNFSLVLFSYAMGVYDYASIMHYGSYDFAVNRYKPVITSVDGKIIPGNHTGMTDCDVAAVQNLSYLDK